MGTKKLGIVVLALCGLAAQESRAAKLEIVSQRDYPPKAFPGPALVSLAVRNAGAVDAREPTAMLSFTDAQAAPLRKTRVRLADAVTAGSEDAFDVSMPRCPDYAAVKTQVVWLVAEVGAPPGELTKSEKIEIGGCRLVRFNDGSLRVTGRVRNGFPKAVQKLVVTFKLGTVEHPLSVPGALKTNAVRDFEFWVPDCPPVEGYSYTLSNEDCDDPKEVEPEPAPAVQRTSHQDATAQKSRDPETPKPDAPPVAKSGTYTVEVVGLYWVTGFTMNNKQYTGDVAFLKLMIRDGDGKPAKPTGKFVAQLSEGKKSKGVVTRYVKTESWGMDARKIDNKNVNYDIVAADKGTGELWVGLVRADAMWLSLTLDVTLTLDKVGTWEWKGLADECKAKPKGPDKPEKK